MENLKHTPGEWSVRFDLENQIRSNNNNAIACVDPLRLLRTEEAEANMKLIAAAPDLLQALENARDLLVKYCKVKVEFEYPEEDRKKFESIRLSIKKATE